MGDMSASDLADWWTKQKGETYGAFADFAVENEDSIVLFYGTAIVGTGVGMAMELGAGFVDVLKIGEGTAKGGWGYAEDGLRALVIAGPMLRVVKLGGAASLKLFKDPLGRFGVCSWISATQALRHTGTRLFASVDDLAKAAGLALPTAKTPGAAQIGGAFVRQIAKAMGALGANTKLVTGISTFDDLAKLVSANARDVVVFSVRWTKGGQEVGHTLYAFRNHLGKVRIVDRSGKIAGSLQELQALVPGYGNIGSATFYANEAVLLVKQATILQVADTLVTLGLPMSAYFAGSRDELDQAYEAYKEDTPTRHAPSKSKGKVTFGKPTLEYVHPVQRGDNLSKISKNYYGAAKHWRVIYDANRAQIGPNPNMLRVGLTLKIPNG